MVLVVGLPKNKHWAPGILRLSLSNSRQALLGVAFHSAQTPDSAEQVGRGLLRIPLAGKNIREEGAFAPR